MNFSAIEPIKIINSIEQLNQTQKPAQTKTADDAIPFKDMFMNALDNYNQTQSSVSDVITGVTTGGNIELHNAVIESSKATLAVDLVIQLRSKALEAYNEIMRMGV